MSELTTLSTLAVSAFLAATLLPGGSEAVFAGIVALQPGLAATALLTATIANTAGGMSTYLLGRLLPRKEVPPRLAQVRRWGSASLLLSWVPLIGDALCAAAGVLRLNWVACLCWMALGKGLRYAAIAWLLGGLAAA
ncbi:YqaA family protein [Thauera sp. AutoDN2]|uniref:YqaA family protein n=2 Tax=unclassified Thauera TaxID=2609274 RepID=UPI003F4BB5B8